VRKTAVKTLLNCLVVCAFSLLLAGCGPGEGTGHKDDPTPGGEPEMLPENATPEDMDAMMKQSEEKATGGGE